MIANAKANPTPLGLLSQVVDSDEDLAKKAQLGESSAAGVLYDRYAKLVFRYFYHLTHHREEAEDLASQLFCQLFERIRQFNPEKAAFRTWMFGAARNLWVDTVRRFGRRPIPVEELPEKPDREIDPTSSLQEAEMLERLGKVIKRLPEDTRLALFLHMELGMEYRDVAKLLGRSAAATKMLVWRAVGRLKRELNLESDE
jgi:RNA polymerase sigma-70 factor, ECF subfamily